MNDLSYCGETVRQHDPDRFLLSVFAQGDVREDLLALFAFNYEIAKTREVVTETQLGLIRLQWWRDALAGIFERDSVLKHQVLEPLAAAIKRHDLPRELFDNLIFAREFDLEDRMPGTLEGMINYADYTATPLLSLALKILSETVTAENIRAIATGYALAGLVRAIPSHLRQRRCYLPENLVQRQQMTIYDLYDGTAIEKLPPVIETVVLEAEKILSQTATLQSAFLKRQHKLARLYLGQIKSAGYNVLSPKLSVPPFMRELRVWGSGLL